MKPIVSLIKQIAIERSVPVSQIKYAQKNGKYYIFDTSHKEWYLFDGRMISTAQMEGYQSQWNAYVGQDAGSTQTLEPTDTLEGAKPTNVLEAPTAPQQPTQTPAPQETDQMIQELCNKILDDMCTDLVSLQGASLDKISTQEFNDLLRDKLKTDMGISDPQQIEGFVQDYGAKARNRFRHEFLRRKSSGFMSKTPGKGDSKRNVFV